MTTQNPQADGPWMLIPADGTVQVRSVDPGSLGTARPGKVVQVLCHGGKRPKMAECRALIIKAAKWAAMDTAARRAMLSTDSTTYADLALAAIRVKKVKRSG